MSVIGSVSRYSSVLGMSYQSYRASQAMTSHVAQMTASLARTETLGAAAVADQGLASGYAEASAADRARAGGLEADAAAHEAESARQSAAAGADAASAEDYRAAAVGTEAEAAATLAEAEAARGVYAEKSEQVLAEAAAAARDQAETESDALAIGICEFVPLVDVVCDVVGAVAATGLESDAALLTAESAVDALAAAAAKLDEETLTEQIEALEEEVAGDEELAGSLAAKAEGEEALAAGEEARAEEEEAEAEGLFGKSEAESSMAGEETAKAEEEEAEAGRQAARAVDRAVEAFRNVVSSGTASLVAGTFFGARILVAVLIPAGAAVVRTVPSRVPVLFRNGNNAAAAPLAAMAASGAASAVATKRDLAYFAGHCTIALLGMALFGARFSSRIDHYRSDVRQQGGVILCFAGTTALAQTILLHALPLGVAVARRRTETGSNGRQTKERKGSTVLRHACNAVSTILRSMLYLVPLFVMELCQLRLLSSSFFFVDDFSALAIASLAAVLLATIVALVRHDNDEREHTVAAKRGSRKQKEAAVVGDDSEAARETTRLLRDVGDDDDCGKGIDPFEASIANASGGKEEETTTATAAATTTNGKDEETWALHQYFTDLILPFEILLVTCMVVKFRACFPIFSLLVPQISKVIHIDSASSIAMIAGGLVVVLSVLWCLLRSATTGGSSSSSNRLGHHTGIWTGRVGREGSLYYYAELAKET